VVQGLDALETGVRMLPASAGLFAASLVGSAMSRRRAPRTIVRFGLTVTLAATIMLLAAIEPELSDPAFLAAMGVFGVGMGLVISQLGNVAQSAVSDHDRSEAGGLQNTAQQLGSSLGTALLGAVVLTGLISGFQKNIGSDPAVSTEVREQVGIAVGGGVSFVTAGQVEAAATEADIDEAGRDALVGNYEDAQLDALKLGFLFAAFVVAASFWATRRLPSKPLGGPPGSRAPPAEAHGG
jgi:hypothetical protein